MGCMECDVCDVSSNALCLFIAASLIELIGLIWTNTSEQSCGETKKKKKKSRKETNNDIMQDDWTIIIIHKVWKLHLFHVQAMF